MGLVEAKCTNCGATLSADTGKDAMICPYCGSAFVVEKAIQNFNNTYNVTNHIVADKVFVNNSNQRNDGLCIQNGIVTRYIGTAKHIDIPEGVTVIENLCNNLSLPDNKYTESVHLPSTVLEVSFFNMTNLRHVYPLNNIKEVSYGGFENTKVEELDLTNVETLGNSFIKNCTELRTLKISRKAFEKAIVSGGQWTYDAFDCGSCPKLENIYIDNELITEDMEEARSRLFDKTLFREKIKALEREKWIKSGKCQYCGGDLKGLLTKTCKACGRKQN